MINADRVGVFGALVLALLLVGCATPVANREAASELTDAVRASTPPDASKARILFFHGDASSVLSSARLSVPAEFFIDGVKRGGINKAEVLVVELEPGVYTFTWDESGGGSALKRNSLQREVRGGEIVYMAAEMDMRYGGAFGIVGLMVDPPQSNLTVCEAACAQKINGLKIVTP
ncbi:MAG: hypothetical protein C0454_16140 [Parvibaculum sp.]|nr:hypothetical protein [Parvibaculum sp.]